MPTIFSHPSVPLALRRVVGPLPRGVVIAGLLGSIAPDFDVVGFAFHVPYGSLFGHRGFTHSIVFALLFAALFSRTRAAFAYVFVAVMSHPLLDAMTNGGLGVAFFSPFSNRRYFFPWRPIEVSPIGAIDFSVLLSELRWVWPPCGAVAAFAALTRRAEGRDSERSRM